MARTRHSVLVAARKLIDTPEKWCTVWYAKNAKGYGVMNMDRTATAFCAVGAIQRVLNGNRRATELYLADLPAWRDLNRFLNFLNEQPDTTHDDVLHAFDELIRESRPKSHK